MNTPRYWTKATGTTMQADGRPLTLTAWGWSATDMADALRNAEDRLPSLKSGLLSATSSSFRIYATAGWLAKYNRKCAEYAVCRYLGEAGGGRVAASIAPILRYHDEQTRVDTQLPLA